MSVQVFTSRKNRCNTIRFFFFFFNDTATTEIYTLSLHDALPICVREAVRPLVADGSEWWREGVQRPQCDPGVRVLVRSEEHTSELQSRLHLVCRLLLEKKKHNLEVWACYR